MKRGGFRPGFWAIWIPILLVGLLALGMTPPNDSVDYGTSHAVVTP